MLLYLMNVKKKKNSHIYEFKHVFLWKMFHIFYNKYFDYFKRFKWKIKNKEIFIKIRQKRKMKN